jgi:peptidoglycan/LPS O-acetylase OafA/YrhL
MLRGAAAISVFFYHALPHYDSMNGTLVPFERVFQWGFAGVDVFFVISGFVMALTTFGKERSFGSAFTFMRHRLFRIFLGYWPFYFLALLLASSFYPWALENVDLLHSFFLTNREMPKLLIGITWTLTFELYFYGIFLFFFALKLKIVKALVHALVFIFLGLSVSMWNTPQADPFFYSPYLLEFFLGVLLYIYRDSLRSRWAAALCLGLSIAFLWAGIHLNAVNGSARILTFGLAGFFLVAFGHALERAGLYSAGKLWVRLGDASYTIYLAHLLLLTVFYLSGCRELLAAKTPVVRELGFLLFVIAGLAFCVFFHAKFENPLYRWAVRKTDAGPARVPLPAMH